MMVKLWHGDN